MNASRTQIKYSWQSNETKQNTKYKTKNKIQNTKYKTKYKIQSSIIGTIKVNKKKEYEEQKENGGRSKAKKKINWRIRASIPLPLAC